MDIKVLVIPIGTHVFVLFNNTDIFLMRISEVIANQSKGDEEQGPTGLIKHHLSGYLKQQVGDVVSTSCTFLKKGSSVAKVILCGQSFMPLALYRVCNM
jgi:hypothetical protein